jgi:hypothetical protein
MYGNIDFRAALRSAAVFVAAGWLIVLCSVEPVKLLRAVGLFVNSAVYLPRKVISRSEVSPRLELNQELEPAVVAFL